MEFKDTYRAVREDLNRTGVYCIYHVDYHGAYYIGSASKYDKVKYRDVGFLQRWRNHFSTLRRGIHHNSFLQAVINKYGLDGIRFDIVEFCDPFLCGQRETFHIQEFKKKYKTFNFSDFSHPQLGVKHSKEAIEKRVAARRVKVYQYDLDGNFISEHISLSEAGRATNVEPSRIGSACKRSGSAGGFQWSYKKEEKSQHRPYYHYDPKPVYQFDCNGNLVKEFQSAMEAEEFTGVSAAKILRSCRGTYIMTGGFMWSFSIMEKRRQIKKNSDKFKPVVQFTKLMEFVKEYESVSDAAKTLNIGSTNISRCCRGDYGYKSVDGFIFKYKQAV